MNAISFKRLGDMGRFGNQLFQVATTVSAAKKHMVEYILPTWEYANIFDHHFNQSPSINSDAEYYESYSNYGEIPNPNGRILNISGFFQSQKYFDADLTKKMFAITHDVIAMACDGFENKLAASCAIHIRHGDAYDIATGGTYMHNQDRHPVMTPKYYENCINHIRSVKNISTFFIFCDHEKTSDWVLNNFHFLSDVPHIIIPTNRTNIADFVLMSCCENNIIANSTFSWWAAWLNKAIDKIVCSPRNTDWFGPVYNNWNTNDLLPDNWIKQEQT